MGKKVTFSEGAELLGVPISTISKWFSQGLFKDVELDRKGPGGGTYYLRLEELLAIKDALEAESRGFQLAQQEIAAAEEEKCESKKSKNQDQGRNKKRLSLVKANVQHNMLGNPEENPGKEIVLRIQEDTAAGLINTLTHYLNNFEQKFLQHMELQADKNAVKYNTMAIEHLETLKEMSSKMEKVVDALLTMPDKVSQDTVRAVQEIKDSLPDMSKFGESNNGTNEKLEAVGKKLERLSEEIKDTKWAVVKMARENGKMTKVKQKKKGFGLSGFGKIFGLGK